MRTWVLNYGRKLQMDVACAKNNNRVHVVV
jgi:hypothetical protein